MKKNAMLKIAAILMVAVLLTTCAISSTFAKYATDGTPDSDTARVAKWGVTFTTKTDGLFLDTYDGGTDVSVKATGSDVVAPGTTNTASVTTDIKGTPEVAFELITTATVDLGDDDEAWKVNITGTDEFYCPLKFKINNTGDWITSAGCTKAGEFETKINNAITGALTTPLKYAAKEYAESVDDGAAFSITWQWDFEAGADENAIAVNNKKDTALGNAGVPAEITVTVTQTAQQIDNFVPPATP